MGAGIDICIVISDNICHNLAKYNKSTNLGVKITYYWYFLLLIILIISITRRKTVERQRRKTIGANLFRIVCLPVALWKF